MSLDFLNISTRYYNELNYVVKVLLGGGKGLMAVDESPATMAKRLVDLGLVNIKGDLLSQFRHIMFDTVELENYVSGVLFNEENLREENDSGVSFISVLQKRGIICGINVDPGAVLLTGTEMDPSWIRGLDNLPQRCKEYRDLGCRFAKLGCVLNVNELDPTISDPDCCSIFNTGENMAQFARICQDYGIVPIVELMFVADSETEMMKTYIVTESCMLGVYSAIVNKRVYIKGLLIQTNFLNAGSLKKVNAEAVVSTTFKMLEKTLPQAVPGIILVSGKQSEEEASVNLDAMNRYAAKKPWALTFSYGTDLQTSALHVWGGRNENAQAVQEAVLNRLKRISNVDDDVTKAPADDFLSAEDHSY